MEKTKKSMHYKDLAAQKSDSPQAAERKLRNNKTRNIELY